jgi:phage/plasmid-associated DNA primase
MLSLASSHEDMPVLPEEIDRDPWLLNVKNGTIDLKTGTLKEHSKSDLITKLAPVKHDASANYPKWHSFLDKVMQGNEELTKYLQRVEKSIRDGPKSATPHDTHDIGWHQMDRPISYCHFLLKRRAILSFIFLRT